MVNVVKVHEHLTKYGRKCILRFNKISGENILENEIYRCDKCNISKMTIISFVLPFSFL